MAALTVELLPEAAEEARQARLWYAARSEDAPRHFMEELDQAIEKIKQAPDRWPKHLRGTRRYRLRHFPFLIVYRVTPARIEIIACQHASRRPGYWRGR